MSKGVKGFSELLIKLNSLGVNSTKSLEKSMGKNIKYVQGEAKDLCPVDLGDLRNSINTRVETSYTGTRGIVFTSSDHAAYQEFGTGQRGAESPSPPKADIPLSYKEDWTGMQAQPFMYPALKNNKEKVVENIKSDLKEAIRKVAKK